MPGRTIIVALDGSADANNCLEWTIDNMYKESDNIVCVHCPEFVSIGHAKDPLAASEYFKKMDEEVQNLVAKYAEILKKKGIPGKVLRLSGKPGEAIVQASKDEKASMVVTGTRGLGTFSRTILGSVSDYVVHNATIPVIVVRKEA